MLRFLARAVVRGQRLGGGGGEVQKPRCATRVRIYELARQTVHSEQRSSQTSQGREGGREGAAAAGREWPTMTLLRKNPSTCLPVVPEPTCPVSRSRPTSTHTAASTEQSKQPPPASLHTAINIAVPASALRPRPLTPALTPPPNSIQPSTVVHASSTLTPQLLPSPPLPLV